MRYFIIFYCYRLYSETCYSTLEHVMRSDMFPSKSAITRLLNAHIEKTCNWKTQCEISNVLEVSQQDFENWTAE